MVFGMREFLESQMQLHHHINGFGVTCYLFVKDGKFAVYSQEKGSHFLSFQIAQGTWYFPLLDKLEERFGKYDRSYDKNGLTYYVWREK